MTRERLLSMRRAVRRHGKLMRAAFCGRTHVPGGCPGLHDTGAHKDGAPLVNAKSGQATQQSRPVQINEPLPHQIRVYFREPLYSNRTDAACAIAEVSSYFPLSLQQGFARIMTPIAHSSDASRRAQALQCGLKQGALRDFPG